MTIREDKEVVGVCVALAPLKGFRIVEGDRLTSFHDLPV